MKISKNEWTENELLDKAVALAETNPAAARAYAAIVQAKAAADLAAAAGAIVRFTGYVQGGTLDIYFKWIAEAISNTPTEE